MDIEIITHPRKSPICSQERHDHPLKCFRKARLDPPKGSSKCFGRAELVLPEKVVWSSVRGANIVSTLSSFFLVQ